MFYTNYHSRKGRQTQRKTRGPRPSCTGTPCTGRCGSKGRSSRPPLPTATPTSPRALAEPPGRLGEPAERARGVERAPARGRAGDGRALRYSASGPRGPEDDAEIAFPAAAHWGGYRLWAEAWSCGSKARRAFTTGRAGAARWTRREATAQAARSTQVPGRDPPATLAPDDLPAAPVWNRFGSSSCCWCCWSWRSRAWLDRSGPPSWKSPLWVGIFPIQRAMAAT